MTDNNALHYYFLLDCSLSMRGEPIQSAIEIFKLILSILVEERDESKISLITFGDDILLVTHYSEIVDLSLDAIDSISVGGLSPLKSALCLAMQLIQTDKDKKRNFPDFLYKLVVFTDGKVSDLDDTLIKLLIHERNLVIFGVGKETGWAWFSKHIHALVAAETVSPEILRRHLLIFE